MSNDYPVLSSTRGKRDTDLGGAPLSDATPAAPGTAAAGVSTSASRDDHVHAPPSAAQVGAVATTTLTANGDLLTRAAGVPAPLAAGSNGYVLTMVGGAPAWAALGVTSPTAVVTLTLSNGGGSHGIHIDVAVTVGGVAFDGALVEVWAMYPVTNIASWSLNTGTQIEIANPGFPGHASRLLLRTTAGGLAQIFYGGTTTGGQLQVSARCIYPDAALATASRTIPA